MKFRITPETKADGSPVLAEERIGRLRRAASDDEKRGNQPSARWHRERAGIAEEEARLAQEPRRWERRGAR
jgi:hypothetical protein